MKLTVPIEITAADSESRTISGRIVAFDEPASASTGRVVFAKGSITPKPVFLNLEHDRTRRIGKTMEMSLDGDSAINATFKIAATTAGSDALIDAMEGLKDGFSVELAVEDYVMEKGGVMRVLAGELTGVALVSEPAVRSARVASVAATEDEQEENSDSTPDSDETPTTEGDEVDNTVTPAEAVETVEAAQSVTASATTSAGVFTTKPRIDLSAATYVENKIKASMGDETARQYVLAADNSTDNAGFVPTPQMTEIVNGLSTMVRPSIDAISRGSLPSAGLSFEIPKVTVAPTAAAADEDAAFSETDQNSAFISVAVKKFASQQKFSVELLTRTAPSFYEELIRNMYAAIAKAQDSNVNAAIITGATADGTTVSTYPTASELLGFTARGAASVYAATAGLPNPFARNLIANTSQWSNIMSLNVDGRPIYTASQPQNAGGLARPDSLRGNVNGLDLFVTANTAAGTDTDGSLIVVNPDAYTWYEDPSRYTLRAESTADGSVTVGLYAFGACATKIGAGAFKVNKA